MLVRSALSRSGLPDLDYSLNPYIGCQHGCLYCYAREYTRHRDVVEKWGSLVLVKENLIELLNRETRKLKPGVVGISTITDPYQPAELTERLARESMRILLKRGFKVSIQTKSPLVLRDLDLLTSSREVVDVGFTIITADSSISSLLEPGAPHPAQRAEALHKISEAGLDVWLFYGPVIPGLNDGVESFREVVELASGCVKLVFLDKLRITPRVRESLSSAVDDFERIQSLVRNSVWWSRVVKLFSDVCARFGIKCIASIAEPTTQAGNLRDFHSE